ncbi:MAG: BamA/TamA family outer membrane protein [Myxococcaceae bacterium]
MRLFLLVLLLSSTALADEAYEERLIAWGLEKVGRARDPAPEGKRVEEILVASEDIISPTDPYPNLLNLVHVTTREPVVKREVLLQPNTLYEARLASETERNLRRLGLFAVARVVAVRGSEDNSVAVLVITKDLWSIRFNSAYNVVGRLFLYLLLRPTEQNFLGLGKQLSLEYFLERGSVLFGQIFTDPRLFGTRLVFQETAALIFNRNTWQLEGTRGGALLGLPLYSIDSKWGGVLIGSWSMRPMRRFIGFNLQTVPYPSVDAPSAQLPYLYDSKELSVVLQGMRSFGVRFKTNLTAGVGGYVRQYRAPLTQGLDEAQRAFLEANALPRSENAVYVALMVQLFEARFAVLRDRDSFALSEDYQLGHSLFFRVRWAEPAWGSPTRFAEGVGGARYQWLLNENLLSALVIGGVRYMPGLNEVDIQGPWVNGRLAAQLQEMTPQLGIGRLVFRALFDMRVADLTRNPLRLGANNGLRGVSSEVLSGQKTLLFNLEYRTRSIEVLTAHLGLVFFYDVGSAFDQGPRLVHSLGVGVRALFPQFDREPFRLDFAWAINGPALASPLDHFGASFGQATQFQPTYLQDRFVDFDRATPFYPVSRNDSEHSNF